MEYKERSLEQKIIMVQEELKAPKNQYNSFGKYKYRSCEDILEAVKPLLVKNNLFMKIDDEIVNLGNRFYIKATINISDGTNSTSVSGYAREEETKKGMDGSQVTGASSSYARKYALNGMFLIDDTKDSDCTNKHDKSDDTSADDVVVELITDEQIKTLKELGTNLEALAKHYGYSDYKTMTKADVDKAIALKKKNIESAKTVQL